MNKMPSKIKEKARQYNKAVLKAASLAKELEDMIEEYDVPVDNLIALGSIYGEEPQTEALAFIHNGECTTDSALESAIDQMEEVFVWFVNNKNQERNSV